MTPAEISALVEERRIARLAEDYARADAIRAQLEVAGLYLKDTKDGTVVRPYPGRHRKPAVVGIKSPTILARTHSRDTQSLICGCGRYCSFGEPGTVLYEPTEGRHAGKRLLQVWCKCGVVHMKFMEPM